jgi:hypothetical protein
MRFIIILLSTLIVILAENDSEKCLRLKEKYPQFNLHCENINQSTKGNIKSVIDTFRQTYLENYKKYTEDNNYNDFVKNVSHLGGASDYKFKQNNDYSALVTPSQRNSLSKSFIDKLSDKSLYSQIQQQKGYMESHGVPSLLKDFEEYEGKEDKLSLSSEKAGETGKRFYKALKTFASDNRKDYLVNGIITPDGHVETDNISNYVRERSKLAHEAFKDSKMSVEGLDKLMHLDNILK